MWGMCLPQRKGEWSLLRVVIQEFLPNETLRGGKVGGV
jgi:hypothetical protein